MTLLEKNIEPNRLPPLVLAYIGDAVYELYVRKKIIEKGITSVNSLHRETVKVVNASSQAKLLHSIKDMLTEEEIKIVKKGRNTKSAVPKNADMSDYRYSTGLEALIGHLFLQGNIKRLDEIFDAFFKGMIQNGGN